MKEKDDELKSNEDLLLNTDNEKKNESEKAEEKESDKGSTEKKTGENVFFC